MPLTLPSEVMSYPGAADAHAWMLRGLQPRPDLTVSGWADRKRQLNKKHSKLRGKWRTSTTPFLREPMDNLSARSHVRRTTLMKGAQVGGTETGLNFVGYSIDQDPAPVLFISPTLTVTKRTSARVQSMIDDDPKGLGRKVKKSRERDGKNSQFEKHFVGGALYFATAKSATNLRSTATPRVIYDEVEAYPQDVEGEGDVVEVTSARTFTFGDQVKELLISTPAIDQTSQIKRHYLDGDQREYFMPCPHCGDFMSWRWEGFAWEPGKPASVRYRCRCCSGEIEEARHKTRMMAEGVWVPKVLAEDPDFMAALKEGDRSRLDAHNANAYTRSYYLPSFYSPIGMLSWTRIVERWEKAQGKPSAEKTIINTIFGLPWVAPGEAPDWDVVYKRRSRSYRLREVPAGVAFLTAGVDVGVDHIKMAVWGFGRRRQRWLVDYVVIPLPTNEPEAWEQLTEARHRVYRHPSGAVLPIRRLLVDRNKWPDRVDPWIELQDKTKVCGVLGAKAFDAALVDWRHRRVQLQDGSWGRDTTFSYVRAGVSQAKLELYAQLGVRHTPGEDYPPGWVHLPDDVEPDLVKEIVSEQLDVGDGVRAPKFVRKANHRAEGLDTANYARIAAEIEGWGRWTDREFDREDERMADAARSLEHELARLASAWHRDGRDQTPTIRTLVPSLVLPEDVPAMPTVNRSVNAVPDEPAIEKREEKPLEPRPPTPPPEPAIPGLRRGWGHARDQADAVGVVGRRKVDPALMRTRTIEHDD